MKNLRSYLILIIFFSTIAYSQDTKIDSLFQYPFGETGKELPRGVYGLDNRVEVKDAEGIEDFVRATAVMIPKVNLRGNKVYGYSLRDKLTKKFASYNFDENIKFLDQPTCASCTGFLIAPDILVTAGHCIKSYDDSKDFVWIFDYTNELDYIKSKKYIEVDPNNIYEVSEILDTHFERGEKDDYSVLKLDRKSTRTPYRFRTSGEIQLESPVYSIGSPTGLPLKFADNAKVISNNQEKWFKNDIDTFPGNSGGPVFNSLGFIEGIHVRGAVLKTSDGTYAGDYKYDPECDCIKTIQSTSAYSNAGAQAHRITSIPFNLHHKAIYENIEYAIINNLTERLNSWITYAWFIDHDYTIKRGRLELVAIRNNNLAALKTIMANTTTNDIDIYGIEVLSYAIDNNNSEMLDYLLYNGADIESVDAKGNNLLHLAAVKGDMSLLKVLINNIKAQYQDRKSKKTFLKKMVSVKNNTGKHPEQIAKIYKNKRATKYLKKARKGKL
jgi:V8-like Glu-specific endopeptidase